MNAACTNNDGSYECACNDGYAGDGFTCEDVSECDADVCGDNTACTNLPGSFSCACLDGFEGDAMAGCVDICECCDAELNECDMNCLHLNKNFIRKKKKRH